MPRVDYPGAARPYYHDRNPETSLIDFAGNNTAPHGNTTRATYTCPADHKAYLETAFASVVRVTAPSSNGRAEIIIGFTVSGGSKELLLRQHLTLGMNVAGDASINTLSGQTLLLAGDTVDIATEDAATGGTVDYRGGCKFTEFDE